MQTQRKSQEEARPRIFDVRFCWLDPFQGFRYARRRTPHRLVRLIQELIDTNRAEVSWLPVGGPFDGEIYIASAQEDEGDFDRGQYDDEMTLTGGGRYREISARYVFREKAELNETGERP